MNIIFLVAIIVAFYFMLQERKKVADEQTSEEPLSQQTKRWVWIICFFNPLWGGAIFYYGWRKKMPVMAKEANGISWKVFLIQIVLVIAYIMFAPQVQIDTTSKDYPSEVTNQDQKESNSVSEINGENNTEQDVLEAKSSPEEKSLNSWYWHYDENGFSLLVPSSYSVVPTSSGITIMEVDETDDVNYTISYRNGVVDSSGVESFAKDVYGKDCEVSLEQDEDSIYDYDEYYVQRGNDGGECQAYKVTMRHVPYLERALTWGGGQEPIMPKSDNSYENWSNGEPLNVNFYDFTMLGTIQFEFE